MNTLPPLQQYPEHELASPETFKQFMPPSNENSMFLSESKEYEVREIISHEKQPSAHKFR